jgi:hypothetical protein
MDGINILNLSQNFLTDRIFDIVFDMKDHLESLKILTLCQNKIV